MRSGTKLATALAITLTVFSGIAAVGATTGLLTDAPRPTSGTVHLVDRTTPARRGGAAATAGSSEEPNGVTGKAGGSEAVPVVAAAPSAGAAGSDPNAGPTPGQVTPTSGGSSAAPAPQTDEATEPEPPPATTPTTPVADPAPPTLDCHGSDDGMSEAEKQARERACESGHDDD